MAQCLCMIPAMRGGDGVRGVSEGTADGIAEGKTAGEESGNGGGEGAAGTVCRHIGDARVGEAKGLAGGVQAKDVRAGIAIEVPALGEHGTAHSPG